MNLISPVPYCATHRVIKAKASQHNELDSIDSMKSQWTRITSLSMVWYLLVLYLFILCSALNFVSELWLKTCFLEPAAVARPLRWDERDPCGAAPGEAAVLQEHFIQPAAEHVSWGRRRNTALPARYQPPAVLPRFDVQVSETLVQKQMLLV